MRVSMAVSGWLESSSSSVAAGSRYHLYGSYGE